jgi:hypothetical protein
MRSLVSLPILQEEPVPVKPKKKPKITKETKEGQAREPSPSPKVLYEPWLLRRFLKRVAWGVICGLALGLVAIYFLNPRVYLATKSLILAPKLNILAFDDNESHIIDLRKSLNEDRLKFKDKRSVCLIFSQDDVLAENFRYLQGCWEAREGRFLNSFSGQPMSLGFCFKKATNEAEFVVSDPTGQTACRAPATAAYKGEALRVTANSPANCSGEGDNLDSFPYYDLECAYSPQGTQATCNIVQHDEFNTVFKVDFRKISDK